MLRGKITYRLLASLIAALSVCTTLSAQSTRVRGRVTDAASGAPMQFVSVVFPGTTTGITTDEEGIYTLETRDTVGRVQASMVGYATQTKPLTRGGYRYRTGCHHPVVDRRGKLEDHVLCLCRWYRDGIDLQCIRLYR